MITKVKLASSLRREVKRRSRLLLMFRVGGRALHVEVVVALELVSVPVDGVAHNNEVEDDQIEGEEVGEAQVQDLQQVTHQRARVSRRTVDENPVHFEK